MQQQKNKSIAPVVAVPAAAAEQPYQSVTYFSSDGIPFSSVEQLETYQKIKTNQNQKALLESAYAGALSSAEQSDLGLSTVSDYDYFASVWNRPLKNIAADVSNFGKSDDQKIPIVRTGEERIFGGFISDITTPLGFDNFEQSRKTEKDLIDFKSNFFGGTYNVTSVNGKFQFVKSVSPFFTDTETGKGFLSAEKYYTQNPLRLGELPVAIGINLGLGFLAAKLAAKTGLGFQKLYIPTSESPTTKIWSGVTFRGTPKLGLVSQSAGRVPGSGLRVGYDPAKYGIERIATTEGGRYTGKISYGQPVQKILFSDESLAYFRSSGVLSADDVAKIRTVKSLHQEREKILNKINMDPKSKLPEFKSFDESEAKSLMGSVSEIQKTKTAKELHGSTAIQQYVRDPVTSGDVDLPSAVKPGSILEKSKLKKMDTAVDTAAEKLSRVSGDDSVAAITGGGAEVNRSVVTSKGKALEVIADHNYGNQGGVKYTSVLGDRLSEKTNKVTIDDNKIKIASASRQTTELETQVINFRKIDDTITVRPDEGRDKDIVRYYLMNKEIAQRASEQGVKTAAFDNFLKDYKKLYQEKLPSDVIQQPKKTASSAVSTTSKPLSSRSSVPKSSSSLSVTKSQSILKYSAVSTVTPSTVPSLSYSAVSSLGTKKYVSSPSVPTSASKEGGYGGHYSSSSIPSSSIPSSSIPSSSIPSSSIPSSSIPSSSIPSSITTGRPVPGRPSGGRPSGGYPAGGVGLSDPLKTTSAIFLPPIFDLKTPEFLRDPKREKRKEYVGYTLPDTFIGFYKKRSEVSYRSSPIKAPSKKTKSKPILF